LTETEALSRIHISHSNASQGDATQRCNAMQLNAAQDKLHAKSYTENS